MTRKERPSNANRPVRRSREARTNRAAEEKGRAPAAGNRFQGWKTLPTEAEVESLAIDPEELRDFLAADGLDVHADPVFRERLRETLWKIVEDRYGQADDDPDER